MLRRSRAEAVLTPQLLHVLSVSDRHSDSHLHKAAVQALAALEQHLAQSQPSVQLDVLQAVQQAAVGPHRAKLLPRLLQVPACASLCQYASQRLLQELFQSLDDMHLHELTQLWCRSSHQLALRPSCTRSSSNSCSPAQAVQPQNQPQMSAQRRQQLPVQQGTGRGPWTCCARWVAWTPALLPRAWPSSASWPCTSYSRQRQELPVGRCRFHAMLVVSGWYYCLPAGCSPITGSCCFEGPVRCMQSGRA